MDLSDVLQYRAALTITARGLDIPLDKLKQDQVLRIVSALIRDVVDEIGLDLYDYGTDGKNININWYCPSEEKASMLLCKAMVAFLNRAWVVVDQKVAMVDQDMLPSRTDT